MDELLANFAKTEEIMDMFRGFEDKSDMIPALCMCIDLVAQENGQNPVDLIDELRPRIKMVNEMFG